MNGLASAEVDTSKIDYYEFLSLPGPHASEGEIRRAGRKTSLLYHPDKVAPTPENLEKFQILQIVIATLSDPAEKTKYDQARDARLRRKAEVEALDARRRQMREDLESREKNGVDGPVNLDSMAGQKRTFSQREMNVRRIAEENKKKMEEKMKQKRFETEQAAAIQRAEATKAVIQEPQKPSTDTSANDHPSLVEDSTDRSLKIRWVREGRGLDFDEATVQESFPAEDIDTVVLLKDKKRKVDGKKMMLGTAIVTFLDKKKAANVLEHRNKYHDFESIDWLLASNAPID